MKKKYNLSQLKVTSFTTTKVRDEALKGGTGLFICSGGCTGGSLCICTVESLCGVCEGTIRTDDCCPIK